MNDRAVAAIQSRDDVSPYMIHLTRDDRGEYGEDSGDDAKGNFTSILDGERIIAVKPHCLHGKQVRRLPDAVQEKFRVACFTETPLSQLQAFLDVRRGVQLEPYGFVFERDFLYQRDAQPATYFNEYHGNTAQRSAYDMLFSIAEKKKFKGKSWRILPFVNLMRDDHDFVWEREYRAIGDVYFDLGDLVCVILPEHERDLRERMAEEGIPAIDPKWSHSRIVSEFRHQQRRTRQIWKNRVPKPAPKPKPKHKLIPANG